LIRFRQNQNLASPKTFNLLRLQFDIPIFNVFYILQNEKLFYMKASQTFLFCDPILNKYFNAASRYRYLHINSLVWQFTSNWVAQNIKMY